MQATDYCPNCGVVHVVYECPEEGETRAEYDRRMSTLRTTPTKDYDQAAEIEAGRYDEDTRP